MVAEKGLYCRLTDRVNLREIPKQIRDQYIFGVYGFSKVFVIQVGHSLPNEAQAR